MLKHEEMLINYRDASSNTEMREECANDLERFYLNGAWWSGSYGEQFINKPKPEFNKLWRSINRIVGDINDMELNALIVSNSEEATDEGAELLQKRWRNDFQSTDGIEASEVATMEAAIGGFGCTKLVAKYEDEEDPDQDKQYLCAEIIHSACNSVYFDAGAIRKDKADSRWGWHLIRTNRKLIEEEYSTDVVSFSNSATKNFHTTRLDYQSERDIYLAHYYELIEKTITEHDFSAMNGLKITSGDGIKDEFGNKYTRQDLDEIKELYEMTIGEPVPTKRRKVKYVEYALCDGEKYLTKPQRIPFKRIPLFPRYGYYAVLNGEEFYCGEIRKQSDAEMFHNFFGSTLMEIMAAPQIQKPEYAPQQISKHANQRARADIDNVPFLLSDPLLDKEGNIAHLGPIGMQAPPQIGSGLAAAGQFLSQNIMEMGGLGQATVPSNSSGEAIEQVNERTDDAFLPIVKNVLHSIKAQCEGWIPAAQALYFTNQRNIRIMETDGTYANITTLEMAESPNGVYGPYGNNPRGKYTVQVEKVEAYRDARDAERQTNLEMLQYVGTDTEFGQLIAMNAMTLTTGEGGDDMRLVARYKMIDLMLAQQIPFEPKNDDEAQYIQVKQQQIAASQQQAQAQQEAMIQQTIAAEGNARMMEGQAALMNEQNDQVANQIKMYEAETKRADVFGKLQLQGEKLNLDAITQASNQMRQQTMSQQ